MERIDIIANKSFYIVVNLKTNNEIIVRNNVNGVFLKEMKKDITANLKVIQYHKGQEYTLSNINERTIQELLASKMVKRVTAK